MVLDQAMGAVGRGMQQQSTVTRPGEGVGGGVGVGVDRGTMIANMQVHEEMVSLQALQSMV